MTRGRLWRRRKRVSVGIGSQESGFSPDLVSIPIPDSCRCLPAWCYLMSLRKGGHRMRSVHMKLWVFIGLVVLTSWAPSSARGIADSGVGPALTSIGPLAFGPDGTLFAADNQSATIFGLDLGAQARGAVAGAKALDGIDQKLAAMLGTGPREITITDLAVHPTSHNAFVAVMRGQGTAASPAIFRIDGAGAIDLVSLQSVEVSKLELANAPAANPTARRNARSDSVTDMAFANGQLWIAGL